MQQQLLQLLSLQVKDMRAARPHLRDAEAAAQAQRIFGAEADALTGEVTALTEVMYVSYLLLHADAGCCMVLLSPFALGQNPAVQSYISFLPRYSCLCPCSADTGADESLMTAPRQVALRLPHELGRRVARNGDLLGEQRSPRDRERIAASTSRAAHEGTRLDVRLHLALHGFV